ncbi:MAG TPA: carbohydrate ABC transporter permease [Methylomirabilota bacterium]|jgi:multiple sugar transport system permease protein|nr:carbohydrate ABC transporter permease [Methylomirabilota bacterium]
MASVRGGGAFARFARDHVGLVPFLLFILFPIYFMVLTAFKTNRELYDLEAIPFWIRDGVSFKHFQHLFFKTNFWRWLLNSFLVSAVSMVMSVAISIFAAYSLTRLRYPGRQAFGIAIFITYLVPPTLLFLPLTQIVNWLGLSDTLWSLLLTYPTFLIPFCTWLLLGYFKVVPREIEECALVDGCSRLGVLFRIVIPIAVPGIICALLFAFTLAWNEFLYALTFTSASVTKTVTVGVAAEMIRGDVFHWGGIMAGAVAGALPVVVMYVFFLDYYVVGLTAGSVKG